MGKHAAPGAAIEEVAVALDDAQEATDGRVSALEDDLMALAIRLGVDGLLRDRRAARDAS